MSHPVREWLTESGILDEVRNAFTADVPDSALNVAITILPYCLTDKYLPANEEVWSWCTMCGECCRRPRVVQATKKEVSQIAQQLNTTRSKLRRHHNLRARNTDTYDIVTPCPFQNEDNRCTVYEARPEVCRAFPFGMKEKQSKRVSSIEVFPYCNIMRELFKNLITDHLIENNKLEKK